MQVLPSALHDCLAGLNAEIRASDYLIKKSDEGLVIGRLIETAATNRINLRGSRHWSPARFTLIDERVDNGVAQFWNVDDFGTDGETVCIFPLSKEESHARQNGGVPDDFWVVDGKVFEKGVDVAVENK